VEIRSKKRKGAKGENLKESLVQEFTRLNKEIAEKRQELIEIKKEYSNESLPSHVQALESILNYKIQRRNEIAEKLAQKK